MKKIVLEYEEKAPKFCDWLEDNFEEGLTFFDFSQGSLEKDQNE